MSRCAPIARKTSARVSRPVGRVVGWTYFCFSSPVGLMLRARGHGEDRSSVVMGSGPYSRSGTNAPMVVSRDHLGGSALMKTFDSHDGGCKPLIPWMVRRKGGNLFHSHFWDGVGVHRGLPAVRSSPRVRRSRPGVLMWSSIKRYGARGGTSEDCQLGAEEGNCISCVPRNMDILKCP